MTYAHAYDVRRIAEDEWREFRALRLEALQDTPIGFGEIHSEALAMAGDVWRDRVLRSATSEDSALFVAVGVDDADVGVGGPEEWIGMAGGFVSTEIPGSAIVYAVYVCPSWRGRETGVAGRLIGAVVDWARENTKAEMLLLEVHEDNERARVFYRRYGFVETGESVPRTIEPSKNLVRMRYPSFRQG